MPAVTCQALWRPVEPFIRIGTGRGALAMLRGEAAIMRGAQPASSTNTAIYQVNLGVESLVSSCKSMGRGFLSSTTREEGGPGI